LLSDGYEVVGIYHDGEAVMNNLNSIKDAIFILDIQLSTDVSGIRIATELNKRDIPFIFITANTEEKTFNEAIVTNPVAYISKPFKRTDVIAGIALASHKLSLKSSIKPKKEKFVTDATGMLGFNFDTGFVEIFLENLVLCYEEVRAETTSLFVTPLSVQWN